jgi:hypothetical protein
MGGGECAGNVSGCTPLGFLHNHETLRSEIRMTASNAIVLGL